MYVLVCVYKGDRKEIIDIREMEKEGRKMRGEHSTRVIAGGKWALIGQEKLVKAATTAHRRTKSTMNGNIAEQKSTLVEVGRRSVSEVESNFKTTEAFLRVRVVVADMPEFMQVHAFRCARRAFEGVEKDSHKHMAHSIKKEFDNAYGRAWHCIVGPSFGSFVTHSRGCFLYFSMEKIYVLVFKTKVG